MRRHFTPSVRDVVAHAKEEALASGNTRIEIPHLLLGLSRSTEDPCGELMRKHGFDADMVRTKVRVGSPIKEGITIVLSRKVEDLLKRSAFSAFLHSDRLIHPFNVLLTSLEHVTGPAWLIDHLADIGLDHGPVLKELHDNDESLRSRYRAWLGSGVLHDVIRSTGFKRILAWT